MGSPGRRIWGRLGVRGRLGTAFVLLATLPALLLGSYWLSVHLRTLETLALQHVESHIALLKERLDTFLSLTDRDLRSLRESSFLRDYVRALGRVGAETRAPEEAAERMFLTSLRGRPAYYRLRFLDHRGNERIKIRSWPNVEYQIAPLTDLEPGVGAYYLEYAENAPPDALLLFPGEILAEPDHREIVQVITLTLPVTDDGALRGFLVLEILAQEYFGILEASSLPPLGTVAVADQEGHYLYHSAYRKDWNLLLASRNSENVRGHYPQPIASRILSGRPGRISGGEQIISFVPLRVGDGAPYALFHAVPKEALFVSARLFRRLFAGLLLAAAASAGLLAVVAAKRFTDPIRTLRSGAAVLASGDLSHRIRIGTGDEVEELARGFNAMAEKLQELEGRLQALRDYQEDIVKSLNDGILVLDGDLVVRGLNAAFVRMTGGAGEHVLGRAFDDVFPAPGPSPLRATFERALRGEVVESEATLPGAREHLVTAQLCLPMRNRQGEITGAILRATDITASRAAGQALRRSEEEFRTLFETMQEGFAVHEIVYDQAGRAADYRFLRVNRAFEEATGLKHEDVVGRTVREVLPGIEASWIETYDEVAATGQAVRFERYSAPLRRHLSVVAYRPAAGRFVTILRDVSERKRAEEAHAHLEEQLLQSRKLEAVGRLAGGIAHDFNNLLGVVTGHSELLLKRLPAEDANRGRLEQIRKAAERAAGLTRQLLAFSRRQVLQPKVLDLNLVVTDLGEMLRRLIGEDIVFEYVCEAELGAVRTDPGQIEQVIMNLAVNARDAMPNGGRLTIETRNVELDEAFARERAGAKPGRYVMLALGDTGHGMDAETQAHIFEPFFTTKELGKGTGLGLSTAYGIVKQSGGYIDVQSELGRGTSFRIYLPRVDEPPSRVAVDPEPPALPRGSETVLLVEDEQALRAIVAETLQEHGYAVLAAGSGSEALRAAGSHPGPIHLLVTDVVMPGMNGRELAESLCARRPGTRVLFVSGYTDDSIVLHGVMEAGVAFLGKPFTSEALLRSVREALGDRPGHSSLA